MAKGKPTPPVPSALCECGTRVVRPDSSTEARICKCRPHLLIKLRKQNKFFFSCLVGKIKLCGRSQPTAHRCGLSFLLSSVYKTPLVSLVIVKSSNSNLLACVSSLSFSSLGQPTVRKQNRPPPASSHSPGGTSALLPLFLALWSPDPRPLVQSGPSPFPSQVTLKFSFCQFNSVMDEEEQEKWPAQLVSPLALAGNPGLAGDG